MRGRRVLTCSLANRDGKKEIDDGPATSGLCERQGNSPANNFSAINRFDRKTARFFSCQPHRAVVRTAPFAPAGVRKLLSVLRLYKWRHRPLASLLEPRPGVVGEALRDVKTPSRGTA